MRTQCCAFGIDGVGSWADNVRASRASRRREAQYLMRPSRLVEFGEPFFAPPHYIRRASHHGRQDLAARPEVHRGRFSAVLLDLELDLLTFIERAQSGALDGGDVHEDIPASTCGLNETIALLRVEPLHRSARHFRILQCHLPYSTSFSSFWVRIASPRPSSNHVDVSMDRLLLQVSIAASTPIPVKLGMS